MFPHTHPCGSRLKAAWAASSALLIDCNMQRPLCPHVLRSTMSTSPADFNAQIIDEFHANEGRVGGMFEGMPLLLLHHTGAKSGKNRINPLAYQSDDGRYVVFASKGERRRIPTGTTTSRPSPTSRLRWVPTGS